MMRLKSITQIIYPFQISGKQILSIVSSVRRLGGARDCCQLPTTGDALAAHIQRAGLYIHPPRASEPPSDRRHRGTILPGTSATAVSSTVA